MLYTPGAVVLGLILLRQRRWRLLALSAAWMALLTALTIGLAPVGVFGDFVHTSLLLGEKSATNPYNGSLEVLENAVSPALVRGSVGSALVGLRFLAGAGLWWWACRDSDDDSAWAYGWLVALVVVPFLWLHYLWVVVGTMGVIIASRAEPDRWLLALPVIAAVALPLDILFALGSAVPLAQALLLLGAIGFGAWLLRRPAAPRSHVVPRSGDALAGGP